jgi:hypothetical protein
LINGKKYAGSHKTENINDGYIGSGRYFLKAIKKYGKGNFKREILETCETIKDARGLEEKYIIQYNTLIPSGYNLAPLGGLGFNGASPSLETIEKIKNKQKGITKINYYIKKYGEDNGKIKYFEWQKLILEKIKGRKHSEETKRLMREKCASLNEEVKIKISKANKGKIRTEETKRKIGEKNKIALLGHKQSEKTKNKRAAKHKGRKNSEETKIKMSLSAIGKPKNYDVWNKNKTSLNINEKIILDIKFLYHGGKTQKEIANLYKFSISCIARILRGFYDCKQKI